MPKQGTPVYIKTLLKPPAAQPSSDRRVWSVPLGGVWIPFFTATNVAGETAISADVLGAPLRLAREQDGVPKFSSKGKPVIRVVKELADQVKIVRENFVAGLVNYAASVQKAMPDEYKAQVEAAHKAGEPIVQKDSADLTAYMEALAEAANAAAPQATEPERELVAA
ncbi:MAG: hypothetical protein AAB403_09930 [Planctomycetota bacterium]